MGVCLVLVDVLALYRCVSFNVFQTEHLPLQTQFKEKGAGGLQPPVSKAHAVLTQLSLTVCQIFINVHFIRCSLFKWLFMM